MQTTDKKLRAIVLKSLYDSRKDGGHDKNPGQLMPDGSDQEYYRICNQLLEFGLIKGELISGPSERGGYEFVGGHLEITGMGVNIVEDEGTNSPVPIDFSTKIINIHDSTGFQIGDHNSQDVIVSFQNLINDIDSSDVSEEDKSHAKSRVHDLLTNPTIASILGGATGGLLGML